MLVFMFSSKLKGHSDILPCPNIFRRNMGWAIYSYYDGRLDIVLDLGYRYIVIWHKCCVFLVLNDKLQ